MSLRLLAVDDELPALEDLVRMLEASVAVERVESAASAEEALVALGEGHDIDAVFLDVRMPGLDGLELARVLSDLEDRWAAHGFVRVHRGFVVNLRRAVEVRPRLNGTAVLVMADGGEVPIARRQVGELRRKLGA
jgi:DNA-binding LytR/AlgR family response regulator